MIEEEEWAK